MIESLNPQPEVDLENQTAFEVLAALNCNSSNSLSAHNSISSSLSHSSGVQFFTNETESMNLKSSDSFNSPPPLPCHQNQNQNQQSFSPLELFQFNHFYTNQISSAHDIYYNSEQFNQLPSILRNSTDNFYPLLPPNDYQQLFSKSTFPPSTYKPFRARSHSFSNSNCSTSERSSYESSHPPSSSPKQTHCTVFDCFKAAFCTLEPCSCTLCRDHLGSVIRGSKIVENENRMDLIESANEVKENKASVKIFRCAGCGLESKEKAKLDKKESINFKEVNKIKESCTVMDEKKEKSQDEKVEEKIFSIHFLPSSNVLVPLSPESVINPDNHSNEYSFAPSTFSSGSQFVTAPSSNDFDIYYQQVPLIPPPPPPPFFNSYPFHQFNPYFSPSPELQPFQPIRRNLSKTSARQNRSASLPTPNARSISDGQINQMSRPSEVEVGTLDSNYRFPAVPTNTGQLSSQIGSKSGDNTGRSNNESQNVINDTGVNVTGQNNEGSIRSSAIFYREPTLDTPLQPYHRPHFQHRRSYSSYVNTFTHTSKPPSNHQSRLSCTAVNLSHKNEHSNFNRQSRIANEQNQQNDLENNGSTSKWPVIKVENIPFETTIEDVENWILPGSLPSYEEVINPIHLILHRMTGRTLPHCFIEINSKERALQIIQNQDRSQIGDRTIRVKWERKDEMMRDLFSQSEYFQTTDTTSNLSLAACPLPKLAPEFLVLAEDLLEESDFKTLTECCKDLQPWKTRPIERPFLNIVSIISKFPWDDEEIEASRDAIFDCAFGATEIAAEKSERFPIYRPFVEKLNAAVERCLGNQVYLEHRAKSNVCLSSGFTEEQKKRTSKLQLELLNSTAPITPPLNENAIPTPPTTPLRNNTFRGHHYNARSWNWNGRGRGRGYEDERKIFSNTCRPLPNDTEKCETNQNNQKTVEVSTTSAFTTPPTTPTQLRTYSHANSLTKIV